MSSACSGHDSVGHCDVKSVQIFDRGVKRSVTKHASGCGVAEDFAESAKVVSLVFFVVVLGHGGVDFHGVVVAVLVTVCAKVAP